MTIKNDFAFITGISSAFFQRTNIKKTLKAINNSEMTGWEKWIQIELAAFLNQRDDVKSWWRESSYELDGRAKASRKKCAVDFLVREKWKHSHMALELKQVNSPTACIQGMLKDKKKIQGIKSAMYDIRSVWCVGVHQACDPEEVKRRVIYHAGKLACPVDQKLIAVERIGYSPYTFTVF